MENVENVNRKEITTYTNMQHATATPPKKDHKSLDWHTKTNDRNVSEGVNRQRSEGAAGKEGVSSTKRKVVD